MIKVGRRLAIKVLNASKFILSRLRLEGEMSVPLDRAMLGSLAEVVDGATQAFEDYDHTGALERAEKFFWDFCDDYVSLRSEASLVWVGDLPERLAGLRQAEQDVRNAGGVRLEREEGNAFSVRVELVP